MQLKVRAVWENGHLRVLDDIDLDEGAEVIVHIETQDIDDWLRSVLGDMVRFPENPDIIIDDSEWEAEIDRLLAGQNIDVSSAIIEDREDRI